MGGHGNGKWMGAFRGAKVEKVGGNKSQKVQDNLEAKMKGYGSGSRAVVRIPGHVFNAENVGGKIKYVDAQTGKQYTSKDVFGRLSKKELKGVAIVRTDNLRVSYRAKDAVKVVERKKR